MTSAVNLISLLFVLSKFSSTSGVIYLEKVIVESNQAIVNISVANRHNADGNSVVNLTFTTFATVTKVLVYIKVRFNDQKNARHGLDLVNTVVDCERLFNGFQGNPFLKGYMENLIKAKDFEIKFPFLPVSSEF